jgi:hypothetical protein
MSDDEPATTGDPQVDEQLASLEKGQHAVHRSVRRTLLITGIGLGGLLLGDLALVLLGGGRWMARDVVMVVGLAGLGVSALYSARTLLDRVIRLDAEVVEELRARARMAAVLDASRPLIEAMRESARTGLPITVVAQHLSALDDDETPTRH